MCIPWRSGCAGAGFMVFSWSIFIGPVVGLKLLLKSWSFLGCTFLCLGQVCCRKELVQVGVLGFQNRRRGSFKGGDPSLQEQGRRHRHLLTAEGGIPDGGDDLFAQLLSRTFSELFSRTSCQRQFLEYLKTRRIHI